MKKIECKICFESLFVNNAWRHIRSHNLSASEYYLKFINPNNKCKNPNCNKIPPFISLTTGFQDYCSPICAYAKNSPRQVTIGLHNKGKKLSENQIKLLSSRRGWNHTPETKKIISESKIGKPRTEETKIKVSRTLIKNRTSSGENNPMWKGGIAKTGYVNFTKFARKVIKLRDGDRCALCPKRGYAIHHIDYDKKNSHPQNLILLCNSCHSKTNNRRIYWIYRFRELMLTDYKYSLIQADRFFISDIFDYGAYYNFICKS